MKIMSDDGKEFNSVQDCKHYENTLQSHQNRVEVLSDKNVGLFLVYACDPEGKGLLAKVTVSCADNVLAMNLLLRNAFGNVLNYSQGGYSPAVQFYRVSADAYCKAHCDLEIVVQGTSSEKVDRYVLNSKVGGTTQRLFYVLEEEGREVIIGEAQLNGYPDDTRLVCQVSDFRKILASAKLNLSDDLALLIRALSEPEDYWEEILNGKYTR